MLRSKFTPAVETRARERYPDGQFHIDNDDFEDFLSAVQLTRGDKQYTSNTTEYRYKAIVRGDIGIHVIVFPQQPKPVITSYGAVAHGFATFFRRLVQSVQWEKHFLAVQVVVQTLVMVITAEEIFREFPDFDYNKENQCVLVQLPGRT